MHPTIDLHYYAYTHWFAILRSFFLKDQLGLPPAESAAILGLATLPWTFKPLYGFLSDSVPLFGYRKRSYLILSGLLSSGKDRCSLSHSLTSSNNHPHIYSIDRLITQLLSSFILVTNVNEGSWLAMSTLVHDAFTALFFTLTGSAGIAIADVVIDSIVVERTRDATLRLEEAEYNVQSEDEALMKEKKSGIP